MVEFDSPSSAIAAFDGFCYTHNITWIPVFVMPRDYRESLFHEEPKRQRSIYLTDATWEAMATIGESLGYSRSELIEQIIRQDTSVEMLKPNR